MINLTEVSLKNKNIVWYFIIVFFITGFFAYWQLGRMEDPSFTIRQMVVTVSWPGATAKQMQDQVTDKLEKKLQDTPGLDYLQSYSKDSVSVIYVNIKQTVPTSQIKPTWKEVRNLANDSVRNLPSGVKGPYFNDQFDDVYGSVYAITGDGFSYEELRQKAEKIRRLFLTLNYVSKAEIIGEQQQKVYVEMNSSKLAELGVSPQAVNKAIQEQNKMIPAGMINTETDNVYIRLHGQFKSVDNIKNVLINANGKTFKLGDIAKVTLQNSDPPAPQMYYNGQPCLGIAVSMENGGNILKLGDELKNMVQQIQQNLPVGIEIHQVSNQPQVVKESISDFVSTLREAIIIVLAVSFFSLGWRTGLVVAGCIPLVIATVFCVMDMLGIQLNKVSLGALIISLGLLVDDAIIAVEMMSVKLEEGLERFQAACFAFDATAKPMLTGTLITCAGFIPVAFSKGIAAEFCRDLFPVIASALLISWIVSVMVAPLYGYKLIKVQVAKDENGQAKPYQSKFYQMFRRLLVWCLEHKKLVLISTGVMFVFSVFMLKFVKEEFFPLSTRPEIIVEMTLPEGSSMKATEQVAKNFARYLNEKQRGNMQNYSYYVGEGAPRFVLTLTPVLPADNYAQFVLVSKDMASRAELIKDISLKLEKDFPQVKSNIKLIQTGPPADYPVMIRISGYDVQRVKKIAGEMAAKMRQDPNLTQINFDWNEKAPVLRVSLDENKLRSLGLTNQNVAQMLYSELSGVAVTQYYKNDQNIDVVFRLAEKDRDQLSKVGNLPIYMGKAGYIPLSQIAHISYQAENGLIWRRNMQPTITVRANIKSGTANDATQRAFDSMQDIRAKLPFGYTMAVEGALHNSNEAIGFLLQPVPIMVIIIMTLLMFQLKKISLMVLTLLTAPLGIIGVTWGMLISNTAMGFVANLGILALTGMIIRNSVILIDQINKHLAQGEKPWDAVIDSAILRFRPIMLTALAAILGMVPLMANKFWAPMAIAISSGLLVATILTLLVLPTMYVAWFKVKEE